MMKRRKLVLASLVMACCLLFGLSGCSDDDDGGDVSRFAGTYSGTFTGDDSGTFTAVIDNGGSITGSGNSNTVGNFSIAGAVEGNGDVEFGVATTGATFSGSISDDGVIAGTWENAGDTGTFSGQRQ